MAARLALSDGSCRRIYRSARVCRRGVASVLVAEAPWLPADHTGVLAPESSAVFAELPQLTTARAVTSSVTNRRSLFMVTSKSRRGTAVRGARPSL
jgi:hypothetical protein